MRRYVLGLMAMAALLAGCANPSVRVAGTAPSSSSSAPTFPVSSNAAPGYPIDDPHRTAVLAAIQRTLAGITLPPGARWTTTAPVPGLRSPIDQPQSPTLLDGVRWYIAPTQTPTAVLAFVRAAQHQSPEGTSTSGSAGRGRIQSIVWGFAAPDSGFSQLTFSVASLGRGSAVRVDAMTTWQPTRPVAAKVPGGLSGARLRYTGGFDDAPAKSQTVAVNASEAERLADVVNDLSIFPPGEYSCPTGPNEVYDVAFQQAGATAATLSFDLDGCQVVQLVVRGKSTELSRSMALVNLLDSLLLPH
jgi:hypothetical protein